MLRIGNAVPSALQILSSGFGAREHLGSGIISELAKTMRQLRTKAETYALANLVFQRILDLRVEARKQPLSSE
jgi:hypothetical protein